MEDEVKRLEERQRRLRKLIRPHLQPGREGARQRQDLLSHLEAAFAEYVKACEARKARKPPAGRSPTRRIKDQLGRVRITARKLRQLLADRTPTGRKVARALASAFGEPARRARTTERAQLTAMSRWWAGALTRGKQAQLMMGTEPKHVPAVLRMLERLDIAATVAAASQPHDKKGAPPTTKRILNALVAGVLKVHGLPDNLRKRIVSVLLEYSPKK